MLKLSHVVVAVSLACGACSSDGGSSGESTASLCAKNCAASDARACPGEPHTGAACRSYCESTVTQASKTCPSQARSYLECGSAVPSSELVCTADHGSDLKPGVCASELQALEVCLGVPSGDGGAPDGAGVGDGG